MTDFNTILKNAIQSKRSNVCVGLDLDPRRIPVPDLYKFNQIIIDNTHEECVAFKPNLAFYEALGMKGFQILFDTVQYIKDISPDTIVIGDAKRGDIGPSAEAYSSALFDVWGFDAITVNPWGGSETILPYLSDPTKGVFIWAKGSNPGSIDLQDVLISNSGTHLYDKVVSIAVDLNKLNNVGLVVGATFPDEMMDIRAQAPGVPFLIPGVGAQGGDLESAIIPHLESNSPFLINSSRGIIYADDNEHTFGKSAKQAANLLKQKINEITEDSR